MKSFVRLGSAVFALGLAGLLTGCVNQPSTQAPQRSATDIDFEVVESSAKRELTTAEMDQLRAAVSKYLEKEGAIASGDYYVKVFLTPDQAGVAADWVVVRFTRNSDLRFVMMGSYPAYSYGYQPYAAYDYYPYGYNSFGRISFHYYNDPYYGYRYYYPRHNHHGGHHSGNYDPNKGHASVKPPRQPGPSHQPQPPATPPPATPASWDSDLPPRNSSPSKNKYPQRSAPVTRQPESPTEPSRAPPPSAPVRTETARSEPAARSSQSYTPPAPREESSQSSRSNDSRREVNEAAAQRERLEN